MQSTKPAVFIASSVEGLPVAEAINGNLDHSTHPTLWKDGTFKVGSTTLADLLKKSSVVDFAIFVFTPDDVASIRDEPHHIARDNVVFELGMFLGALGPDRCYIVKPRGVTMHLPSDVLGINTLDYASDRPDGEISSALNYACTEIKRRIQEVGTKGKPEAAADGIRIFTPNPPSFDLTEEDFIVLGQCVEAQMQAPTGIAYHRLVNGISITPGQLTMSVSKLLKLGLVERAVETDQYDYYVYSATDDGADAYIKNEQSSRTRAGPAPVRPPAPLAARAPKAAPKPVKGSFEDMEDDIPF